MVVLKQTLTPTIKFQTIATRTIQIIKETENLDLSTHPLRPVVELTNPQRNVTLEQTQRTDRLPGINDRKKKPNPTETFSKQLRWEYPSCSPNFKLETTRLHSGAAIDRPETTEIPKLPPIPEIVWQQHTENDTKQDNLNIDNKDLTLKTNVASQTSPPKGTQSQNYVDTTENPPRNQTGNEQVLLLDCSKNSATNTQNTQQHVVTTPNADTTTSPLTTATPLIEEGLVRDEQTNEVYLPLTSTVVLKRKQEVFYVPLYFENNLTVDALVDSGAFVSAIAQDDLETIKQKAPNNILKIDDPPNFQIQVANGQLEKPLSTATLKFEIGDNSFAEHFVVMKKLTGPIIGLHFMWNNSVVIDTTHGLIHFPHLTMQVKTASSETTTKLQPVIIDDALTIPPMTTKKSKLSMNIRQNGKQQGL